ncbi:RNA polymerase sigma factor, sigma-70 family [Actinoalloteichus hymeniacidonis]|uniref:RNA polymerase sigma factor, sigma-70 family n=1 Tax=Actinoalloteichus hymeniacidonis TaxID=340345 RepID=A0AAC9HTN8_9PSEU|nr:RNA polymerase sigma factor, sigma-70 family [Actinoalloteichus hymeniacidonis]
MAIVPDELPEPPDTELIDAVRDGSVEAYGTLYERHVTAAYNLARQLAQSRAEQDDLVANAFTKVLDQLRMGNGPDVAFRAYLLTALRNGAYDRTRKERRVSVSDDVGAIPGADVGIPFHDAPIAELERSLAARAFARLPERWRTVLWHTEVEGESVAEVAPLLGLTPNGVSALAYRAREGLRQAYLQVHLAETQAENCRAATERLGAWTRSGLSKRETAQVDAHLDGCLDCRALAAELTDLNGMFREIGGVVLGAGASGYLTVLLAKALHEPAITAGIAATTGGSVVGATSSLPRQWLTAAASTVALVATIAVTLLADAPPVPAALPAPAVEQPARPVVPPAPEQPVPESPAAPAEPGAPAPSPPLPAPPAPPEQPAPTEAVLEVTTPPESLVLSAGGPPGALPISVANVGSADSEIVVADLRLPPGISARLAAANSASVEPARSSVDRSSSDSILARAEPAGLLDAQVAPAPASPSSVDRDPAAPTARPSAADTVLADAASIDCSTDTGSLRCASAAGLAPGASLVFDLEFQAAVDAEGGRVTGTVGAGGTALVELGAIEIEVRKPVDDLALTAEVNGRGEYGAPWLGRIVVTLTNTGSSTDRAEVRVRTPWWLLPGRLPAECDHDRHWSHSRGPAGIGGHELDCAAERPLAPGDSLTVEIPVTRALLVDGSVEVTGELGTASGRVTAPINAPDLVAVLDTVPTELVIGAAPEPLSYRVRNQGAAESEAVELTLRLPPGVAAEDAAGHGCRSEADTITCRSAAGLAPGGEVSFDFTLRAMKHAATGSVAGDLRAGPGTERPLPTGRITVVEPPEIDAVQLTAEVKKSWALPIAHHGAGWSYYSLLRLTVVNTGQTTRPGEITVLPPDGVGTHSFLGAPLTTLPATGSRIGNLLRCGATGQPLVRTTPTLQPGQSHEFYIPLCTTGGARPPAPADLALTATLGGATQHAGVEVRWDRHWFAGHQDPAQPTDAEPRPESTPEAESAPEPPVDETRPAPEPPAEDTTPAEPPPPAEPTPGESSEPQAPTSTEPTPAPPPNMSDLPELPHLPAATASTSTPKSADTPSDRDDQPLDQPAHDHPIR